MVAAASWGLADQALSSLTNFALALVVARRFDAVDLGAFAIAFNTYLLLLNVARPLAMQPVMIHFSNVPYAQWHRATQAAVGLSLTIGLLGGALTCIIGALIGGSLGGALVATGLSLPGLLVQDSWRLAFFAAGRGVQAFLNDLVWTLVLLPSLVIAILAVDPDIAGFFALWGGSALVAALFGMIQARTLPRPELALAWLRDHRILATPLTVQSVLQVATQQIASLGVAAVAGLGAVGALRAAQLLLGPLLVLFQGLQLIAIPEGREDLRRSRSALRTACYQYGAAMGVIVIGWGGLMYLVPDDIGILVLGQNWVPAHEVILPISLAWGLGFAGAGLILGMRVLANGRRVLVAGGTASVASAIGMVVGAAISGAPGAAGGNVVAQVLGLFVARRQFETAIERPDEGE